MNYKTLAESLHPFERKVLPLLKEFTSVIDLSKQSGLQEVEVTRAIQWLENKKACVVSTEEIKSIVLSSNALKYKDSDVPERKLLNVLSEEEMPLSKIKVLSKEELNACIGILKKLSAINVRKDSDLFVSLTDVGVKLQKEKLLVEKFLSSDFPKDYSSLTDADLAAISELKKRKDFIVIETRRIKHAKITTLGVELSKNLIKESDMVDSLSAKMLREGSWKGKSFRRYDVEINVPKVYGGKAQAYRAFLDSVRDKLVAMGFEEMQGPIVESDFWDMDALFMPQFHSARDIHDAYYVKDAPLAKLPADLVKKVKEVHETGGKSGSSGWNYNFDVNRTKQQLLRTQTTACSARMLASKDLKIPGKYFSIARCFRYDVIDATHLPDFNQTEGFVIGDNLTFRHLIGLLKTFAYEFADAEDVRVVPGYFPFTEPSAEIFAKHPTLGWIELGGAGMFRPEVVKTLLGEYKPVIAWGLGIGRIGMLKLGLKDIRQLFSHDLTVLRESRLV